MSDIVERLRAWSPLISSRLEVPAAALVMDEAATEIERLNARVAALERVLQAAKGMWDPFYKLHAAVLEAALKAAKEAKS